MCAHEHLTIRPDTLPMQEPPLLAVSPSVGQLLHSSWCLRRRTGHLGSDIPRLDLVWFCDDRHILLPSFSALPVTELLVLWRCGEREDICIKVQIESAAQAWLKEKSWVERRIVHSSLVWWQHWEKRTWLGGGFPLAGNSLSHCGGSHFTLALEESS